MTDHDELVNERKEDMGLAERLLARDEAALRKVIAKYGPGVHGVARRVIIEPTRAEEVAQDTFLAIWRRPGAFDPSRGSLQSFLFGVARNKAVDVVRKEESLRRTKDSLAAEMAATPEAAPETTSLEERQEVRDALGRLSEIQREALVLAYFGGRTYREVAEELGVPEGTAKTRMRDGLLKLRELMGARES
jgi:RNA polymerase sigma-70 factor (ECF subfamily)